MPKKVKTRSCYLIVLGMRYRSVSEEWQSNIITPVINWYLFENETGRNVGIGGKKWIRKNG